jgi:hypothetical protein
LAVPRLVEHGEKIAATEYAAFGVSGEENILNL